MRIVVAISSGPKTTKVRGRWGLETIQHFQLFLTPELSHPPSPQATQSQQFLIGSIGVSGKTKWDVLDGVIRRLFKVNGLCLWFV